MKIYYSPPLDYSQGYRERILMEQGLRNYELTNNPNECDFIIMSDMNFPWHPHECHLRKHSYNPNKVLFIDWPDNPKNYYSSIECLLYFKRSWQIRKTTKDGWYVDNGTPVRPPHYRPITYAVLDQFITDLNRERTIDIGYFFGDQSYSNRARIRDILLKLPRWNKFVGVIGNEGGKGRSIFDPNYLNKLKQCKIVVTCQPDKWTGDTRTWEAFASGALVALDNGLYLDKPLIHKKHCILYETTTKGILKLIEEIDYYLTHPEEAIAISKEGREFVLNNHCSTNRMQYIIQEALHENLARR